MARELLSYARNRLRCRPKYRLFDAWYPSKALLKRIHDYGWYFVCRLKKDRRFNGQVLRAYRRHPYWGATGQLTGGLKGLAVRYGAKYYATNRLTLPAAEVRRLYRVRAHIEAVIKWARIDSVLRAVRYAPNGRSGIISPAAWSLFASWNRNGMSVNSVSTNSSANSVSRVVPMLSQR